MNAKLTPEAAAMLAVIEAELLQREAAELRGSLLSFVRRFWAVIEPGTKFRENWHHRVICEHLEAVSAGTIKNLIINVPPGTSKSTLVSVMWPAWEQARGDMLRVFGASYGEPLAIRDAALHRKIVMSADFQALFPHVNVRRGADQKTKFEFEDSGWRMATSVGGRGTGEHPNRIIIDDPHNVKQSESDVERQSALEWFDGTVSSRGVIHDARTVIIMQRLHAKDLTGHVMNSAEYKQNWAHLVIEMEYEPGRKEPVSRTPLKFKDPRKKLNELLWPDVFTAEKVTTLKAKLGDYRASGQLQQRPAPAGGGILQTTHVQLWPRNKQLPDIHYVIQSYDTAFKEKQENDPCGCEVWGMFYIGDVKQWLLLDAWDERLSYPNMRNKMMEDWKARYGGSNPPDPQHPPRRPDMMLIEDKASGQSIIQELRKANLPVRAYNPGQASKTQRAHMASAVLEAGVLWVLESNKEPGRPVMWARPVLKQWEEFPNGEHDEYVDTFSQFAIYAAHADLVDLPAVPDEPVEDDDYYGRRQRQRNVYSE